MIDKQTLELTGAAGKLIYGDITVDNEKNPVGTIIFIHGFKGFKDWGAHNLVADWFAERGYRYIKFNLSHSGVTASMADITDLEAFGANTFSMELEDIDKVISYVATKYPKEKITVIGHSRGGGLAIIQAANDQRIDKLITWASIGDFKDIWKPEQEQEWEQNGVIYIENARTKQKMPLNLTLLEDYRANKEKLDIQAAAARIEMPWLIVHGTDDPGVPVKTADELAQLQPNAKLVKIEGADHVFGAVFPYLETFIPEKLQEVCEKSLRFIVPKPFEYGIFTPFIAYIFRFLQKLPPQVLLSNRVDLFKKSNFVSASPQQRKKAALKRSRQIDIYILSFLLIEILGIVLVSLNYLTIPAIKWGIVIVVALRIVDIIQVNVNLSLFDLQRTGRQANYMASAARTIVNVFINYLELILCFGLIYSCWPNYLCEINDWTDPFYFSTITQVTLGFDNISPTHWIKLIACTQLMIGYFFTALIIGRFISILPHVKTIAGDSQSDEKE